MYLYKISKSSWGIIINLDIKTYSEIDHNSHKIGQNLYLKLDNCSLIKPYHIFLINGLKWVENNFKIQERLMVSVESIQFSPCDFQEEGLFFAIASWAHSYFKLEELNYDYTYKKIRKKYIFNFSEGDLLGRILLEEALKSISQDGAGMDK